jgi:transcriptional regulator with XRE-family HTH domain
MRKGDLARRAGLHPNTISNALGGRNVSILAVRKLGRALGIGVRRLLAEPVEADKPRLLGQAFDDGEVGT